MNVSFGEGCARRRLAIPLEALVSEQNFNISMSAERTTQSTYLTHYISFCCKYSMDYDPTPNTLSLYITATALNIAPTTIETYLSGIAYHLEPYYLHVRASRKSDIVRQTLQGACKRFARPV
jgi:hypothetical protein